MTDTPVIRLPPPGCLLPALRSTSPRRWNLFTPWRPSLPPSLRPRDPPERLGLGALARRGPDTRTAAASQPPSGACGLPRVRAVRPHSACFGGHLPKRGDPAASPEPPGRAAVPPPRPFAPSGNGAPGSRLLSFRACAGFRNLQSLPRGGREPEGGQGRGGGRMRRMRSPGWAAALPRWRSGCPAA